MNLINRIRNLIYYIKVLDANREELFRIHNIKIDYIYRMYLYYKVDEKDYLTYGGDKPILYETNSIESYLNNSTKSGAIWNGEKYVDLMIEQKIRKIDEYLINIGLSELYGLSSKKKIDKTTCKIVIEFKLIKTLFWANMAVILAMTFIASIGFGLIFSIFYLIF